MKTVLDLAGVVIFLGVLFIGVPHFATQVPSFTGSMLTGLGITAVLSVFTLFYISWRIDKAK